MKQYAVSLSDDAKTDLRDIYDCIAEHDAPAKADGGLNKLEALSNSLSRFPERGAVTKELRGLGIKDYREVYFKPYRVIYRVLGSQIYGYLIVDGRRDMQTLLTRRLIRAEGRQKIQSTIYGRDGRRIAGLLATLGSKCLAWHPARAPIHGAWVISVSLKPIIAHSTLLFALVNNDFAVGSLQCQRAFVHSDFVAGLGAFSGL